MDPLSKFREQEETRKELRELKALYLEGRRQEGRRSEYGIAIIGTGNTSQTVSNDLADNPWMGDKGLGIRVNRLSVISKNRKRAENLAKALGERLPSEGYDWDNIEEGLQGTDIAIVCTASKEEREFMNDVILKGKDWSRMELGLLNAPLIKELAPRFEGYQGSALIVTNHTDLLSYVFALYSGLDPDRVWGCNHIDTVRFRNALNEYIEQEFSDETIYNLASAAMRPRAYAIAWGPHDHKFITSPELAIIDNLPANHFLYGKREELMRAAENQVKSELKKSGHTAGTTTKAVRETLEAALTELGVVEISAYIDFNRSFFGDCQEGRPSEPVYLGIPRFFYKLRSRETPFWAGEGEQGYWKEWFSNIRDTGAKNDFFSYGGEMESALNGLRDEGIIEGHLPEIPTAATGSVIDLNIDKAQAIKNLEWQEKNPPLDTEVLLVEKGPSGVNVYSCRDRRLLGTAPSVGDEYDTDGKQVAVLETFTKRSPKGRPLTMSKVLVYQLGSEEPRREFPVKGSLSSVRLYGERLLAGSSENSDVGAVEWDIQTGELKNVYNTSGNDIITDVLAAQGIVMGAGKHGIYAWDCAGGTEPRYGKGRAATRLQEHGGILLAKFGIEGSHAWTLGSSKGRPIESLNGIASIYRAGDNLRLATVQERKGEYTLTLEHFSYEKDFLKGRPESREVIPLENNLPKSVLMDRNYLFFAGDHGLRYIELRFADHAQTRPLEFREGSPVFPRLCYG